VQDEDQPADDKSSAGSSWTVRDVRGRRARSGKGLATFHSLTAQRRDGAEFVIGRLGASEQQVVELEIVARAAPMTFDSCPICLEPDPTSKEHVPPAAVGGSVMTRTCHRCNSRSGSVLESALVDWWEDAVGSASMSHKDVPGARRTSRVLLRQKDTGEPVLVLSRVDPAIAGRLGSGGEFSMTFAAPDPHRYRLAALKSSYLAACLLLRTIPDTPEARAVRAELMASRDIPRRARPEIGDRCGGLRVEKSQGPAVPGEVLLVQTRPTEGTPSRVAISLARTLLISWPLGGYLVGVDAAGNPTRALPL
jgi:hypothetical protein